MWDRELRRRTARARASRRLIEPGAPFGGEPRPPWAHRLLPPPLSPGRLEWQKNGPILWKKNGGLAFDPNCCTCGPRCTGCCRAVSPFAQTISCTIAGVNPLSNCLKCTTGSITQGFNLGGVKFNGTFTLVATQNAGVCSYIPSPLKGWIMPQVVYVSTGKATPVACFYNPNCDCTEQDFGAWFRLALWDTCPQQLVGIYYGGSDLYGTWFNGFATGSEFTAPHIIANSQSIGCGAGFCAGSDVSPLVQFGFASGGTATIVVLT